jgi:hypothetical protein
VVVSSAGFAAAAATVFCRRAAGDVRAAAALRFGGILRCFLVLFVADVGCKAIEGSSFFVLEQSYVQEAAALKKLLL